MWYVIGYAFNDEFIRNMFQESLTSNESKKLLIIDPAAEQIRNKFDKSVVEQIDALPIRFGDDFFELQFTDCIENQKTIHLRIVPHVLSKNQFTVGIKSNRVIKSAIPLNSDCNVISSDDSRGRLDKRQILIDGKVGEGEEVKLELKIEYAFGDEIELNISDGTGRLNFGIDYDERVIASSHDIKNEYEQIDGALWMTEPIKLDKTKLYHRYS